MMKLSGAIFSISLCLFFTAKVSSRRSNAIVETQEYGDPCSEAEKCRTRFGTIFCNPQDATCGCVDPDSMVWDEQEEVCVSKFGAMCYTRPLKNRNIRNCVTGATCVGVSKKSVFGTCQEGLEEEEQYAEEEEQEEEQKEDKPVQLVKAVETKDEEIYETTEENTTDDTTEETTDEPEASTSPPEETSTPEVTQPETPTSTPGGPEPETPTSTQGGPEPETPTSTQGGSEPETSPSTPAGPEQETPTSTPGGPEPETSPSTPAGPEPETSPSTPAGPEPETPTSTPGGPEPETPTSTPGGPEPEPTTSTPGTTPPTGPIIDQPCGDDLGPCSVENSVCNSNNRCVCQDDFTPEYENTMCKIRALRPCDPDAREDICITNSTCSAPSRSCECDGNRVPKNGGSHCALMINEICEVTDDCLENADCIDDGPSPTRRCTCWDGYTPSEDNLICSGPGTGGPTTEGPGNSDPTTQVPISTSTEVQSTTDSASWSLPSTFLLILATTILGANR